METFVLVVHLIIALALIGVVLLQRSEGGALGIGGGGGGGGGGLFTARGAGNTLTRTTAWLAVAFFCTSIALTVIATHRTGGGSVIDNVTPPAATGNQPAPAEGSGAGSSVLPQLAPPAPAQPQVPVNQ
jgi:preprotein translocase subunit SecG